ncbi:MAG: 30S ribosome-binding factor RbfA [Planctomycetota bacterium]|jgi:ribosome-binding factor A
MSWNKNARTEALLKERVAIVVLEQLSDPRLGFVTITGVELSGDKRHAKVRFTVLGTPAQRRTTERALKDAAPHIQEILAPGLRLRNMPELRFVHDESVQRESRMLELLDEIKQARGEEPADVEPDGDDAAGDTADDTADHGGSS